MTLQIFLCDVSMQKTNAALKSFGAYASKKFGEMR